jgi:hypothetical protein
MVEACSFSVEMIEFNLELIKMGCLKRGRCRNRLFQAWTGRTKSSLPEDHNSGVTRKENGHERLQVAGGLLDRLQRQWPLQVWVHCVRRAAGRDWAASVGTLVRRRKDMGSTAPH